MALSKSFHSVSETKNIDLTVSVLEKNDLELNLSVYFEYSPNSTKMHICDIELLGYDWLVDYEENYPKITDRKINSLLNEYDSIIKEQLLEKLL